MTDKQVVYVLSEEVWTGDGQAHTVHGAYSSLALAEAAIEHLMQETTYATSASSPGVLYVGVPMHWHGNFSIEEHEVTSSEECRPPLRHEQPPEWLAARATSVIDVRTTEVADD